MTDPTNWLDGPEILSVVFHPRREWEQAADGFTNLAIPVDDGVTVGGRFYEAGEGRPTILFFHGNGEIVADYADIASFYTSTGANFLPVDYRGYGRSTGQPTVTTMLADALAVFTFAREWLLGRGFTGPLVVMGRSLGSASALAVAATFSNDVAGLIIDSGFADTVGLLKRLGARLPATGADDDGLHQSEKMAQYNGPVLIIHGSDDFIIPVQDAHALLAASPGAPKRLLVIDGAGHNDLLFRGMEEYMAAVTEVVGKVQSSSR